MRNKKAKRGFTLVELLIATSIFSVFLVAIVTLTINMYRDSKRIELEEQMYQDMRALMRQITVMVEGNAIDYEEYFRAQSGDAEFAGLSGVGGNYAYGDYAKRFYDFGSDGAPGILCNSGIAVELDPGCTIDRGTIDLNVGQNPIDDLPENGNAFCGAFAACPGVMDSLHEQDQLYLINANGTRKTILALEPVERDPGTGAVVENALSTLWLTGSDSDGDDITDTWAISDEFNGAIGDMVADLGGAKGENLVYNGFIPISPLRTNITSLKFYISPLEDPYKGFAETDVSSGTLVQPHITVVMTAEPSVMERLDYFGLPPTETLQTTIYSDVRLNVRSY
jgi:prepilin-type N-terminal cleavage/methylation domain-containing protein